MKTLIIIVLTALSAVLGGCDLSEKSTRRFRLPQGNAEQGKAAFIALNCTKCHTVAGIALPPPSVAKESVVALGGDVARIRTYGDLLTSIVHPAAEISEKMLMPVAPQKTPMPVVNDIMTVAQMVDLVAFLQPRYSQLRPAEWYYSQ